MSNRLLWDIILRVMYIMLIFLHIAISVIPSDQNLWVYTAGSGDRFSGNTKYQYIYNEKMSSADLRPIWISKDSNIVSLLNKNGYEAYPMRSLKGYYFLIRSGYIFYTHGNPFWVFTGNSTVTQLWHGVSLKEMGNDKNSVKESIEQRIYNRLISQNWNNFVVTSTDEPLQKFNSAFNLNRSKVLETGYPRNDIIFSDIEDATIGQEENINQFKKWSQAGTLIVYMPTWRRAYNEENGIGFSNQKLPLKELDHLMSENNATLVLKFHPAEDVDFDTTQYNNVYLIQESFDVYPILSDIDVLITDYSSIFIDYLLVDSPIVFYPFDLKQYSYDRGFHFNYEQYTPGPKATTSEELLEVLDEVIKNPDKYREARTEVREKFHSYIDGGSARRVTNSLRND